MLQASLPVRDGGLGIRSVASVALSAFLASAASTRDLQSSILTKTGVSRNDCVDNMSTAWSLHSLLAPSDPAATKQSCWDAPSIAAAKFTLLNSYRDNHKKARLAAVSAPHSGDRLHAIPISSCGLRLDNEAIRISDSLRLGINLCVPHTRPCGTEFDARGTHGLSCKRNTSRFTRLHQLNDLILRALCRANIPSVKEPAGHGRSDVKRPDDLRQIPWQHGKCLTWDVTVADTVATSYLQLTSVFARAAAENAAEKKEAKYAGLSVSYTFLPLAFESLGPINEDGLSFSSDLGRRISVISDEPREASFIFQRMYVLIQRFNAISFTNSFPHIAEDR